MSSSLAYESKYDEIIFRIENYKLKPYRYYKRLYNTLLKHYPKEIKEAQELYMRHEFTDNVFNNSNRLVVYRYQSEALKVMDSIFNDFVYKNKGRKEVRVFCDINFNIISIRNRKLSKIC